MIQIRRSAIVHRTDSQMYELVNDFEAYPRRFQFSKRHSSRRVATHPFADHAKDCQASAMAAIETFRPGIFTGSLAPCRAGGLEGNHFKYSSFMP